jgi:NAD+ diphosphatase
MLWFIFYKTDLLLKINDDDTFSVPEGDISPIEIPPNTTIHKIQTSDNDDEVRAFSVETPIIKAGYAMCSLRQSYYRLSLSQYLKAGKCQELIYWDHNTKYCGVCGNPMRFQTNISKRCVVCGKEVWPSPATAVITLIYRGNEILLVQARNFQGKYFGLVAGFVETGESVEEAAIREIREEVGIEVKNLKYSMSQPWPFPSVLMIGFTAEYKSGEIKLQYSELADGGWYHRDNLPQLPGEMGTARKMIAKWLKETSK